MILATCRTFPFINKQKINFIPHVLLEILQRYGTFYFEYFRHACLCIPKMIISTCRTLQCLSVCKKLSLSFTSFLRYYILKNLGIRLVKSILAKIWDWWWNIKTGISCHVRVFSGKTNDKIFQKIQKKSFGAILGPFFPNLGKNEFSWEKRLCQFLNILIIYHHAKKSEKTNEPFREKCRSYTWT